MKEIKRKYFVLYLLTLIKHDFESQWKYLVTVNVGKTPFIHYIEGKLRVYFVSTVN